MFSWFLLTRSISGVNTTGVPLAELSLYMTYRTEAQRPPGDSQTLWTVHRPTAPIGRLSKTRIKALQGPVLCKTHSGSAFRQRGPVGWQ